MHPAGQGLHLCYSVNFVPEKFNPDKIIPALSRIDFNDIPVYPEASSLHVHLIACILNIHQFPQYLVPVFHHSRTKGHDHILIFIRTSQSVDTRHTGHHYHIPALRQGNRRRQPQLVNLVIYGRILCNIGIGRRHICLRLIIIIIGDKVFYRIFREKFLELAVELSGQGLIVRYDQSGLVQGGDDIGHGKGLAGTGDTQQSLKLIALLEALHQFGYGRRLVPGGLVFGMKFEAFLCILHNTTSLHL